MTEPVDIDEEQAASDDAVRYRPRGRVIPAEEIRAWQSGHSFMQAAAREAERLREDAVQAFEDAKKRGFEEGRKEGAEAASRLLAETTLRADRHLAGADQQIVDLALAVVRRVLGDFDVGQLTRNAVRHALARQRHSQHLTLHVAPDMIDELRAELDASFEAGIRHLITVEPDPRVERGQCRLASEVGFVDLGIEAQLEAIRRGLSESLEHRTQA